MATSVSGTTSTVNGTTRMTGMVSGLDVDSLVKAEMQTDLTRLDTINQKEQLLQWKQADYRTMISTVQDFSNTYFDVGKPTSNFTSASAFSSNTVTSSNQAVVTATTNANATPGTHTLQITSIASAAKYISGQTTDATTGAVTYSNAGVTGSIAASSNIDTSVASSLSLKGKQISVTLDGTTKVIDLDNYNDLSDLQIKLQSALKTAFGQVKVSGASENKVKVDTSNGNVVFGLSDALGGSSLSVADVTNTFNSTLGFANGKQNYFTAASNVSTSDFSVFTGGTFKVSLNGAAAQVATISNAAGDINSLTTEVQKAIDTAVGSGKVTVQNDGSKLNFISNSGDSISFTSSGTSKNILSKLGVANGSSVSGTASSNINLSSDETGKSFIVNINGTDNTIKIDKNYSDIDSLVSYLNDASTTFANDSSKSLSSMGITVSKDSTGQKLVFSSSNKLIIKQSTSDGLSSLGFDATDVKSNRMSLSTSLYNLRNTFSTALNGGSDFDENEEVQFSINGVDIDVGKTYKDATITDVMNAINKSSADVKLTYDSTSDKFTLATKGIGADKNLTVTDNAQNLLASFGIMSGTDPIATGTDAVFKLDNASMVRNSNDFQISGVIYSLKGVSPSSETETVSIATDVDGMYDKIKAFVDKYNTMIAAINTKVSEKKNSDYPPLTSDERSSMTETEITQWETKAKAGMLYQDSLLSSTTQKMRSALYESIYTSASDKTSKLDYNLASIGITTGTWSEQGKLVIDETKLKNVLTNNPDEVINLFTKQSSVSYSQAMSSPSLSSQRYKESGIAQRLSDAIQDAIRTTRDISGHKGTLVEAAGIAGDASEYNNSISKQLTQDSTDYNTLLESINSRETALYSKYSTLETTLSQLQSQSSWVSSNMK